MIPQVTAAALVSENKSLAFPASVDSIPTSAGQEDHVSMAPIAARKAAQIARNAAGVIAVELIAARAGHRLPRAAEDLAEAAGGPRQGPRAFAALDCRPLLGRRDGRASGGGAGGRDRRRGLVALQLTPRPALFLAQQMPTTRSRAPSDRVRARPGAIVAARVHVALRGRRRWPL